MKSKLFYLLTIPIFCLAFLSCSNDDEESYTEWRKENEAYIEGIKTNPNYFEVSIKGGPGSVYCKKMKLLDGIGRHPIYTEQVNIRYKGKLINGTVFEDSSERTATFTVGDLAKGFAVALQNMRAGDKWEVNIPWELGYGISGKNPVPPYSALIFELELISISER